MLVDAYTCCAGQCECEGVYHLAGLFISELCLSVCLTYTAYKQAKCTLAHKVTMETIPFDIVNTYTASALRVAYACIYT